MKNLDSLTDDFIKLLHKHNCLVHLVRCEIEREELSHIELDKQLMETLKKDFKEKTGVKDKSDEELCRGNHADLEDFDYFIYKEAKLKLYCLNKFSNKVESYFLKTKDKLDRIVYSLLRGSDKHKATELYLRISEEGASFSDISYQYSEGAEQITRGIVGPTQIGKSHKDLAKHLTSLKPGEISPPIKIENYYVVVRIESFAPAKLDSFMREKLALELYVFWIEDYARDLAQKMLDQAHGNVLKSNVL